MSSWARNTPWIKGRNRKINIEPGRCGRQLISTSIRAMGHKSLLTFLYSQTNTPRYLGGLAREFKTRLATVETISRDDFDRDAHLPLPHNRFHLLWISVGAPRQAGGILRERC